MDVNLVEALQDILRVLDFGFTGCCIPAKRLGKGRGDLIEKLPGHQATEGK
ncbi:hypothetical protein D3C78_1904220 [compost metagenome]